MRQYNTDNLLVRSGVSEDPDLLVEVIPEQAGWDTIHFQARRLAANGAGKPAFDAAERGGTGKPAFDAAERGGSWSFATGLNELALVILSGRLSVDSSRGRWENIGQRESVFAGLPYALYLPMQTSFTVTTETGCEFAIAWVPVGETAPVEHPPRLVTPADIGIEIRGGGHATRQINSILPPGFPCRRLVVVEVYTPGGNWSSYPPHKHDVHRTDAAGKILEADLDEIYYYKIDRPEGYAVQRVYTDPSSPLHQAGYGVDALLMPRSNDVVLVPEGYHPVSSPPGYTSYYLNVLAGSAQSLAATDDPDFSWVKTTFNTRDPRVPIYDVTEAKK